ncbi:hypothetical protein BJX96DRAFT_179526 [Aspergillus floccosus]
MNLIANINRILEIEKQLKDENAKLRIIAKGVDSARSVEVEDQRRLKLVTENLKTEVKDLEAQLASLKGGEAKAQARLESATEDYNNKVRDLEAQHAEEKERAERDSTAPERAFGNAK